MNQRLDSDIKRHKSASLKRAIFLDRDGVINVNRPDHIKTWDEFIFLPRALDALRRIAASDFLVIVTTNQSGVSRGSFSEETLLDIHTRMVGEIRKNGGRIDAVYFCPHKPEEKCECRKPGTKMYRDAAREWSIDLSRSYMIGDAMVDVQAALAIGSAPLLVLTGRGERQHDLLIEKNHSGFQVVADLWDAVEWIWVREKINGKS
jgi:D-glycero-D-manno-heptose 1,7-bisphosphate phosphatase